MDYPNKKNRKYSELDLKTAVENVLSSKMTVYRASKEFKIPWSTLKENVMKYKNLREMEHLVFATVACQIIVLSSAQFPLAPGLSYPLQAGSLPNNMSPFLNQAILDPYYQQYNNMPGMLMRFPNQSKSEMKKSLYGKRKHSDGEENSKSLEDKNYYKRRRQVLTPIISYINNKGRVIYSKKIRRENMNNLLTRSEEGSSEEITRIEIKHKSRY